MVHTNPEFETSNLILDFEFDQHLESHKHVINIIMWFRDMGCYTVLEEKVHDVINVTVLQFVTCLMAMKSNYNFLNQCYNDIIK
jgi:hypothetical protein